MAIQPAQHSFHPKTLDFPRPPSADQQRKELQNIVDSYSHTWDIAAELAQNAVDEIHRHRDEFGDVRRHEITVTIDRASRSLTIRDTGLGFDPQAVVTLLEPHATGKPSNGTKLIGQKGVGLTYVICMSDHFELTSASVKGHVKATITNLSSWRRGASEALPQLAVETDSSGVPPTETFAEITIRNVDRIVETGKDFFDVNDKTRELILRTRTALGCTKTLFTPDHRPVEQIDIVLRDAEGGEARPEFSFLRPAHFAEAGSVLARDAMIDAIATMDDAQKRKYLSKKCVEASLTKLIAGREVRAYAFYAPFGMLREINKRNAFDEDVHEDGAEDYGYSAGIFLATRGMPTGIELAHPRVGEAGYWSSLYIVIEDDNLQFDLGRKSIPSRTVGSLRGLAKDIFDDLTRFSRFFSNVAPNVREGVGALHAISKDDKFAELATATDLNVVGLAFEKVPADQEAGVVAIFHELIGRGILRGYRTMHIGYKLQYDWWGHYMLNPEHIGKNHHAALPTSRSALNTVIEFKYKGESIIDDFEDTKELIDIDIVVCWDFDEEHLRKAGFMATPLSANDALYHGTNYMLECIGAKKLGSAGKVPMLCLRQFLHDFARTSGVT